MTQESPHNHEKLIPINYTDKVLVTVRNGLIIMEIISTLEES